MIKVIRSSDRDTLIHFQRCIDRLLELQELYLSIQSTSGFTVEQLLKMFMAGYTMEPPSQRQLLTEVLPRQEENEDA